MKNASTYRIDWTEIKKTFQGNITSQKYTYITGKRSADVYSSWLKKNKILEANPSVVRCTNNVAHERDTTFQKVIF